MGVLRNSLRFATFVAIGAGLAITVSIRTAATTGTVASVEPAALPLVQEENVTYVGAFRLPIGLNEKASYSYSSAALGYWPEHNSLLVSGNGIYQMVGEVAIPTPGTGNSVSDLPRAEAIQQPIDILDGKLLTVDGSTGSGVNIGGFLPMGSSVIVNVWDYYDTHVPSQTLSHFVTGQGAVRGPFRVGNGYTIEGLAWVAGFVSGYMAPIPAEWQSALGGTAMTGQGGNIPIISRTSSGPAASVFNPADLGNTNPVAATPVVGYPSGHQTLGIWGQPGGLFDGSQTFRGMIFPPGTRTVLFFGWGGTFCYGQGTIDPALKGKPDPATGEPYCFDPTDGSGTNKGVHTYPTSPIVWAYDVNDLVAVKKGQKKPWDLRPYATWRLNLPFQSKIVNGLEAGHFAITGASYDPATHRIFLATPENDGIAPLIHVLTLNGLLSGLCR